MHARARARTHTLPSPFRFDASVPPKRDEVNTPFHLSRWHSWPVTGSFKYTLALATRFPWSFGCFSHIHTCHSLRVGRSHYAFLDKLTTTGVVGKDYGFMLVWRCNFVGNHLITFGLFLDEVMGLSQYC